MIYLIFNEGYAATAGDDWMRPELCEDALRLGRILAELAPHEPEVHGLVALMEIQASRAARARRPDGRADPAARAGPRALGLSCSSAAASPRSRAPRRSAARAARTRCRRRSPRATPARARAEETDWPRIAALYDALARAHAVAGRRAQPRRRGRHGARPGGGARARRRARDGAVARRATTSCRRRAATCSPSCRFDEARAEFERAAALTRNAREQTLLLDRAATCARDCDPKTS